MLVEQLELQLGDVFIRGAVVSQHYSRYVWVAGVHVLHDHDDVEPGSTPPSALPGYTPERELAHLRLRDSMSSRSSCVSAKHGSVEPLSSSTAKRSRITCSSRGVSCENALRTSVRSWSALAASSRRSETSGSSDDDRIARSTLATLAGPRVSASSEPDPGMLYVGPDAPSAASTASGVTSRNVAMDSKSAS